MDKNIVVKKEEIIGDISIDSILKTFKNNLHSVSFFFERFRGDASDIDENALKSTYEYVKNAFKKISDEDIQNNDYSRLMELSKTLKKAPKISVQNYEILSSSSFLMLNNYFEYLLADLLTYYYNKYKSSLSSKEFKISLREIGEYESIEELENNLIMKEVETMLIDLSFDGLKNHFKTKFNLKLNEDIVNWDLINECRERRHLIVHNACVVNKKYISRTNNPDNKKIGDKISITEDYFQLVYNEIKLAGLLLSYECWGSWDNEKSTNAINDMLNVCYDYLINNNTQDSKKISTYIINSIKPRNDDEENLLMRARFNYCIALKKLNDTKELNKSLSNIKIGTFSPLFKLAHSILADKDDSIIFNLIEKSYKLEEIDLDSYLEWPLFDFIREKDELNDKIVKFLSNV